MTEIPNGGLCVYPWQCKSNFCCPYLKVGYYSKVFSVKFSTKVFHVKVSTKVFNVKFFVKLINE